MCSCEIGKCPDLSQLLFLSSVKPLSVVLIISMACGQWEIGKKKKAQVSLKTAKIDARLIIKLTWSGFPETFVIHLIISAAGSLINERFQKPFMANIGV